MNQWILIDNLANAASLLYFRPVRSQTYVSQPGMGKTTNYTTEKNSVNNLHGTLAPSISVILREQSYRETYPIRRMSRFLASLSIIGG